MLLHSRGYLRGYWLAVWAVTCKRYQVQGWQSHLCLHSKRKTCWWITSMFPVSPTLALMPSSQAHQHEDATKVGRRYICFPLPSPALDFAFAFSLPPVDPGYHWLIQLLLLAFGKSLFIISFLGSIHSYLYIHSYIHSFIHHVVQISVHLFLCSLLCAMHRRSSQTSPPTRRRARPWRRAWGPRSGYYY